MAVTRMWWLLVCGGPPGPGPAAPVTRQCELEFVVGTWKIQRESQVPVQAWNESERETRARFKFAGSFDSVIDKYCRTRTRNRPHDARCHGGPRIRSARSAARSAAFGRRFLRLVRQGVIVVQP